METDHFSCEKCGCVVDVKVLRKIISGETLVTYEKENINSNYIYRDYEDFEKIRCPACKYLNQR